MRPRHASLLSLSVVVALLAGCGGGDDSTESTPVATIPTTTAVTQAELIERGDAICAEVNAAVGTVGATSTEAGGSAGQVAGLYAGMVDSLKGIGVPQESEGYPEFIAAAEALATAEDEVELASEREDTTLETAESNASSALADFQAAAEEYGFEDCSEGPSAPVSAGTAPESGETESSEVPEESEAEAVEPEVEAEPEPAPETGGAGGTAEGGGTTGAPETGGETGGSSGGIGP